MQEKYGSRNNLMVAYKSVHVLASSECRPWAKLKFNYWFLPHMNLHGWFKIVNL